MTSKSYLGKYINTLKGFAFKSSWYLEEGVPLVKVSDFTENSIQKANTFLSMETAKRHEKYTIKANDVIVQTVGSWPTNPQSVVGKVVRVPKKHDQSLLNQNAVKLIPNSEMNNDYLFYLLKSPNFFDYITGRATGAASQASITLDDIKAFEFVLPKMVIQKKISSVLSAYDNLIENNNRRIAILEEMAMRIYREWFVHFRFPGYENVKMVESELGLIPEGWMISTPKNVVDYYIGGGWGKDTQSDSTFPAYVIRGTDIPQARINNVSECPLRYHKKSNLNSRILTSGDIVIEVSGGSKGQAVGRSLLITHKLLENFDVPTICASFCKLFRCNSKISSYYFYMYLKEIYNNGEIEKYQLQSTGIINFKFEYFLENAMFIFPPQKVQDKFEKIVRPLFEEINLFGAKNTILRKTRDHLLPYLISGDIDVSKLPIHIKED